MTGIVERLRRLYVQQGTNYVQEAADEIERLRAELKAAAFCDARCSWVEHHPGCVFSERDALRAELDALKAAPPSVPEGWQLVPVEPTKTMTLAAYKRERDNTTPMYSKIYAAMLAAAPKPGDSDGGV